jgi:hypothetical protein
VWREGYHPLAEVVQPPVNGFLDEDDQRAYETGTFHLNGHLPVTSRRDGLVTWKGGGRLKLPLMDARKAYEILDRNGSDGPALTVTGAKPGEMTLTTNHGPTTVPAWLFTLDGYATPLRQAAVSPSKLPEPPVGPVRNVPGGELTALAGLVDVAGDGRSVSVLATHGGCDDGPAVDVLETRGSVVLSAYVVGTHDGPCDSALYAGKVNVRLAAPLGDRVLLDASTGRPVPLSPSPGWS